MDNVTHEKRCSKCGETKALDLFWRSAGETDGRRSRCVDCMRKPRRSDEDRFWSNVDRSVGPDACWLWRGRGNGYGTFRHRGKNAGAHRIAHVIAIGPIPHGCVVMHRCDNPPCVNPAHLRAGTQAENIADRDAKGRTSTGHYHPAINPPRGELRPNAKLTAEKVREIRDSYAAGGVSQTSLAREHGVDQSVISEIVRRLRWTHV
jgi:hypothetical protein